MEDEKLLPPGIPSPKAQSWGVVISIAIIVLMIVIGAFYSWGKRIAENRAFTEPAAAQ
ncbi:hypothetical protein HY972_00970 [Candidatus Kaiserbacteria bacterium]|nr:hypothetical protein [Candidatus Kaiserbacteria bacterium]